MLVTLVAFFKTNSIKRTQNYFHRKKNPFHTEQHAYLWFFSCWMNFSSKKITIDIWMNSASNLWKFALKKKSKKQQKTMKKITFFHSNVLDWHIFVLYTAGWFLTLTLESSSKSQFGGFIKHDNQRINNFFSAYKRINTVNERRFCGCKSSFFHWPAVLQREFLNMWIFFWQRIAHIFPCIQVMKHEIFCCHSTC